MGTLTIGMPNDKVECLKALAAERQISVNRLIDELLTIAITEHDTLTRFRLRAARGSAERGLEILDKLDELESAQANEPHFLCR